jgi:competence protein ComEC
MRCPSFLVSSLAAFAVGVCTLQRQSELPRVWLWGLIAVLACALTRFALRRRCVPGVPVAAAVWNPALAGAACLLPALAGAFAIGFAYAAWRAELRLAAALPPAWEGEDISIVGVIDELPQSSERGVRFMFAVETVATPGAAVPPRLSLAWYAEWQTGGPVDPLPVLCAGERWQLTVRLKRPHGSVNPHGFDVEAWLLENNVRATGYVRRESANLRLSAFAGRASDYVARARSAVRDRVFSALPNAAYAGVLVALAIGEQRAISEAQWQVFNRTGVTHLVSISGMHVTVFATLAGAVVFALARRSMRLTSRIPARRIAALAGVIAAAGYVLLAGAQVPAQRTLLMLIVAAVGLWIARPGTAALVWLWSLVAVLVLDPWAPLAPGFWLSFGAVGLLLYGGAGRRHDAAAATRGARLRQSVLAAMHAQALITIGMVPLTLALFQQVSLIAPLANAVAIPLVTFVVVPLALVGVAVPADLLWQIAHAVLSALMWLLELMAEAPSAVWQQHAPAAPALIAAGIGVLWLAAPRGTPLRWLGVLWLMPLFLVRPVPPPVGAFRMTVLDVGQGLAVAIETHGRALLYDTGPRYSETADAGSRIVAPYLRGAGIARLDAMVVSHHDNDHSGGTGSLLRTVPIGLLLSSVLADSPLLATLPKAGPTVIRCEAGQRWEWDGVVFTLLHPTLTEYANPRTKTNDLSCVLRVDSPHGSTLLTGDIEAVSEASLLDREAARLKADVLVVPHHGSRSSSTPAFIAAVAPEVAVFTPGYRNRFGHPRPEIVARYARSQTWRTDLHGALSFSFSAADSLRPRAERDFGRRYWHDLPLRDDAALD